MKTIHEMEPGRSGRYRDLRPPLQGGLIFSYPDMNIIMELVFKFSWLKNPASTSAQVFAWESMKRIILTVFGKHLV